MSLKSTDLDTDNDTVMVQYPSPPTSSEQKTVAPKTAPTATAPAVAVPASSGLYVPREEKKALIKPPIVQAEQTKAPVEQPVVSQQSLPATLIPVPAVGACTSAATCVSAPIQPPQICPTAQTKSDCCASPSNVLEMLAKLCDTLKVPTGEIKTSPDTVACFLQMLKPSTPFIGAGTQTSVDYRTIGSTIMSMLMPVFCGNTIQNTVPKRDASLFGTPIFGAPPKFSDTMHALASKKEDNIWSIPALIAKIKYMIADAATNKQFSCVIQRSVFGLKSTKYTAAELNRRTTARMSTVADDLLANGLKVGIHPHSDYIIVSW